MIFNAYFNMWKYFDDFSSRTRRRDYWLALLMHCSVVFVIIILPISGYNRGYSYIQYNYILTQVYSLMIYLPLLAISVRRLHDVGMSGFWLLIGIMPYIGRIVILVITCMDSAPDNKYGPNPKIK